MHCLSLAFEIRHIVRQATLLEYRKWMRCLTCKIDRCKVRDIKELDALFNIAEGVMSHGVT